MHGQALGAPHEDASVASSDDEETDEPPPPRVPSAVQRVATPTPVPLVQLAPKAAPAPKAPVRTSYQPTQTAVPPRSLVASMQHKMFRPTQIPAWEFFNPTTAAAHLTEKDVYSAAAMYRERCQRIHRTCPRADPPEITDTDSPTMAKYKFDTYYKHVASLKSALQVGNLIYLGFMGLEAVLKYNPWFKIKAQGLYAIQYANREEFYSAMLDMGERTVGWFKESISPMWRMLVMFCISTVVLIAANYLLEYVVPQAWRGPANQFKDLGVRYVQDMLGMFMGVKAVDPEKADDGWMETLFAGVSSLATGTAQKPPSAASTHFHDE